MEFNIAYEIKGQQRKQLVKAVSDYVNTLPKYLSLPTCAYEVGNLLIDWDGMVIIKGTMIPAEVGLLIKILKVVK